MIQRLHKNATTTPRIRAELQAAPPTVSTAALARKHGISEKTVARWRSRTTVGDGSHTPKNLKTSLSPAQEEIVVEVRRTLLLPIDDLLVVVREFIEPTMSRAALDRMLRRHGVSNLKDLVPREEPPEVKKFKTYLPGYVHVDVKFLPRMADEKQRGYLFVGIDRATRWVYVEVLPQKSAEMAEGFMQRLIAAAPFRIEKVLTDNGGEFTDRFRGGEDLVPTGKHKFDRVCATNEIEHRLITPWKPQTNGMVERFNGRIQIQLEHTHFDSVQQLTQGLQGYAGIYNGHIPQRALGHRTPIQALKDYFVSHPERFRFDPANLPGLDM